MEDGQVDLQIGLMVLYRPDLVRPDIADWMVSGDAEGARALEAFVDNVPISSEPLSSIRHITSTINLPPKDADLEAFMRAYGKAWFRRLDSPPVASADAACLLFYYILILDEELQGPDPTSFEQFSMQLRACNDGDNFDDEMLQRIYRGVRRDPLRIRIPTAPNRFCSVM